MIKLLLTLMTLLVPLKVQKISHGESEDDARARYAMIAEVVAEEAGEDETLMLFLLAVARHESGYVKKVHAGKLRGDDGRSWGLFQVMVGYHPTDRIKDHPKGWLARDIAGTSRQATERAVWTAAWILRPIVEDCKGGPTCVFKRYGGVAAGPMRGETKESIEARVSTFHKLRRALEER